MKLLSLCSSLGVLLATVFAFTSISSMQKTRCPGDIAGLRPRVVAGALLVIPVKINQAGPFDFMVTQAPRSRLSIHYWPQNST